MKKVKIEILKEGKATLPQYMSDLAAGADLFACLDEEVSISPHERKLIPTGIKMSIPKGYEIELRPRSGLALKHGITLANSPGTIDADYRGEVKVILVNLSTETYNIKPMERIAQMLVKKVYKAEFEEVEELEETQRGAGGFGHTGKH